MHEAGRTDEDILVSIQDLYALDARLRTAAIRVQVANGKVLLSGVVTSDDQRRYAAELARQVPGVAGVVNELVILPPVKR